MKLSIKMFNIIIYSLTVVFVSIAAITDASDDLLLSQASIFVLFLLFFMFIQHTLLRPINSMIDFAAGKRNTIDKSIFSEVNLLGENVEKALSGLSAKNKRANELLQKFFNNMHDGVLIHDMQGHIIDANDTAIKMFGASEKNEMLRLTIPEISTDNNPISRLGDIWQNVLIGKEMKFEWEGKRLDDKSFWIEVYLTKVEHEEDTYILANLIDITEAKKQRVLIELIMDLQENIVFLASNEKIVIANNSFMNYFSFDSLESTNEHFHCIKGLFLDYELECEQPLCKFGRTMKKEANKLICVRQDGQREIFLIAVNTLFVDEELYIVSLTDITSMELEKEILELKSNIDHLTSLKNRGYFDKTLQLELAKSKQSGEDISVIMFDIDRFKNINDTLGHKVGDDALKVLAEIVTKNTRKQDVVARYGGEEFMIIAPGIGLKSAVAVAEKIRDIIDKSKHDGVPHFTCSFGVATWDKEESETTLLKRVDTALYAAKDGGRNMVVQA